MGNEIVFLEPNSHPIKMSEIILEFADDMLRHSESNAEKRRAIDFACVAWNLALFKKDNKKDYLLELNSFLELTKINMQEEMDYVKSLINELVNKKIKEYANIDRLILHYQIDFVDGELILNVASTIVSEEINEFAE